MFNATSSPRRSPESIRSLIPLILIPFFEMLFVISAIFIREELFCATAGARLIFVPATG